MRLFGQCVPAIKPVFSRRGNFWKCACIRNNWRGSYQHHAGVSNNSGFSSYTNGTASHLVHRRRTSGGSKCFPSRRLGSRHRPAVWGARLNSDGASHCFGLCLRGLELSRQPRLDGFLSLFLRCAFQLLCLVRDCGSGASGVWNLAATHPFRRIINPLRSPKIFVIFRGKESAFIPCLLVRVPT